MPAATAIIKSFFIPLETDCDHGHNRAKLIYSLFPLRYSDYRFFKTNVCHVSNGIHNLIRIKSKIKTANIGLGFIFLFYQNFCAFGKGYFTALFALLNPPAFFNKIIQYFSESCPPPNH